MISEKVQTRIGWTLSIVMSVVFAMSAVLKISGNEEALQQAAAMGIDSMAYQSLGYVELFSIALLLFPRTGLVGILLLMIYMGGAICAHLVSHQSLIPVVIFEILLWITASLRFPELRSRLFA